MVRLIWLGAFVGGGHQGSERPVDLLFRDLESVVRLFRITLMDAKIRNAGRGGGLILLLRFMDRASFTSLPSWRRLISIEKSSHFALLAELSDGHFLSIFRLNGRRTLPILNPVVKLFLQL